MGQSTCADSEQQQLPVLQKTSAFPGLKATTHLYDTEVMKGGGKLPERDPSVRHKARQYSPSLVWLCPMCLARW